MAVQIAPARADDCAALTALSMAAKASHGYDAAFMAACEDELRVRPYHLTQRDYLVAWDGAHMVGCVCLYRDTPQIGAFFVAPNAQGRGVGRALWQAIRAHAKATGADVLTLDSDPNAVGFYQRLGFVVTGHAPSGSIAGRFIPTMEWRA